MNKCAKWFLILAFAVLSASSSVAQITETLAGQAFGSFDGGPDSINLGNLNVHWDFPIISKPGRGLPFEYKLTYDSTIWTPVLTGSTTTWTPNAAVVTSGSPTASAGEWFGWPRFSQSAGLPGYINSTASTSTTSMPCTSSDAQYHIFTNITITTYSKWEYVDPSGVHHSFPNLSTIGVSPACPLFSGTVSTISGVPSGDGYIISIANTTIATITDTSGNIVTPASGTSCGSFMPTGFGSFRDMNGNQIAGNCGTYTDSLGQTVLTMTGGTPPNTMSTTNATFTVSSPSGTSAYVLNYAQQTVRTNFGCSGVAEYGPTTAWIPSTLVLPDGRQYSFTYEQTSGYAGSVTGRLATVTLPSGGVISYSYSGGNSSGNPVFCSDGTTGILARSVSNAGAVSTTTYTRANAPTTTSSQTAIAYPAFTGSDGTQYHKRAVIQFAGTSSDAGAGYYEVARQIYNAAGTDPSTTGTLLETILTCYAQTNAIGSCATSATNALASNGTGASFVSGNVANYAIYRLSQWPDSTGITSGVLDISDTSRNNLLHAVYDFGANGLPLNPPSNASKSGTTPVLGKPLSYTSSTYAQGAVVPLNYPTEVASYDSSGNMLSDTQYTYNGSSVITTSNTPMLGTSSTRMNPTTIKHWVSGSTYLTESKTYYDTGNVATSTDVNGGTTTYTYGACGNTFPTSVVKTTGGSTVTSLTTSETWNCAGGVPLTVTDANSNQVTNNYGSDPYWRPVSVTDGATGVTTNYTYQTSSSNSASVSVSFNGGNSVNNVVTTYDSLGRPELVQKQQGPGSAFYDSVATAYDALGRVNYKSVPFSAAEYAYSTASAGTTSSYDVLGRPTLVTDAAGGTVAYTYSGNDVLVTTGPAPSSEKVKQRNLEHNGAGQLTSVCEVVASSSLTSTGNTCGQHASYFGYLTKYTYVGGNLVGVAQNANPASGLSQQTRSFVYDGMGRLTRATIPEWSNGSGTPGTTNYTYDTDSTCGTSAGDLVKKVDNVGNASCYTYDKMHRILSSYVASGAYQSATPSSYFVYDAAPSGSPTLSNVLGALTESYTTLGGVTQTTEYYSKSFSSSTGNTTSDIWQSTVHSGGLYHSQEVHYANGALYTRTSLNPSGNTYGVPNIQYTLDGEGRPNGVRDTTTGALVPILITSTVYNVAGAATAVNYQNGDVDSLSYDTSNRITQIKNTVAATMPYSLTTALTWNTNGSLQSAQFTDTNDNNKNQTCTYAEDDLSRLSSVNCGSTVWAQNFTYDVFGNIIKTGAGNATSYTATYNALTNQVSNGVVTRGYDANGNQLSSNSLSQITWTAGSLPATVTDLSGNQYTAVYDALGRAVESDGASANTVFLYSPSGDKIAKLSAGALVKSIVPLTGGQTAEYNVSGLQYVRHVDWLGSSRLATTWGHTVYSKESYAPFGETYNEAGTPDRSFTGKEQETVTGNLGTGTYEFPARDYDPGAGRWLSPDWSAKPDPVPYGNLNDPQTLNLYAYVANSPIMHMDVDGHTGVVDGMAMAAQYAESNANDPNFIGESMYQHSFIQGVMTGDISCEAFGICAGGEQLNGQTATGASGTDGSVAGSGTPAAAIQLGHASDPTRPWGSQVYSYQIVDGDGNPVTGNNVSVKENDMVTSVVGNVPVINRTSNDRYVSTANGVFADSVGPTHKPKPTSTYDATTKQTFSVKVGSTVFRISTVVKQQTVVVKGTVFCVSATIVNP